MTDTAKVLAQSIPTAGVLTDTYTVPAATSAIVSTIKVANTGVATTFRISVAVAGLADTLKQYLYYDVPIAANDTFAATEGWTLATTDVIRCYSGSGNVAFNIFGVQITP